MKRRCVMCMTEFEAKRPNARYCSDRCRQRYKRAGGTVPAPEQPDTPVGEGKSGAAARAWLQSKGVVAEQTPAAADLLVVADAIDAATAGGQIQFVAALARQAAALRAELTPRVDPDDPDGPGKTAGGQEGTGDGSSGDGGPGRRSFDAAAL